MHDLASRLNALADEVRPLGGQVVERASFSEDLPRFSGFLSIDGDHSPMHDIPQGYLVVGRPDSEVMIRHRMLLTGEVRCDSAEDRKRAWAIASAVARRAEQGREGSVFIASELPTRPASSPPLVRDGSGWASGPLSPRIIESKAMDLLCSLLEHRRDLELSEFRQEIALYIARPWPAGDPDPVRPWEKAIPAPGGNILAWPLPDALVQGLIDDAIDLALERSTYRRLAARM